MVKKKKNKKNLPANAGDVGLIPGSGRAPRVATHSSILALKIPWLAEPCGLQFMGLWSLV